MERRRNGATVLEIVLKVSRLKKRAKGRRGRPYFYLPMHPMPLQEKTAEPSRPQMRVRLQTTLEQTQTTLATLVQTQTTLATLVQTQTTLATLVQTQATLKQTQATLKQTQATLKQTQA
ncbi:MAG: hypothetical protein GY822_17985, partial [Deltaproteobacteria bacterium]|nr:hypothetical protein [Deltaproteobacteria bacterium]